jgi:hypothetical protein
MSTAENEASHLDRGGSPPYPLRGRLVDDVDYVLSVLHRMKDEVSANPNLFEPHALERIKEAIARI